MTNSLRILIVGSPTLGGSGAVARAVASGLADRGHQVCFLSYALPLGPRSSRVQYEVAEPITNPLFPSPLIEHALAERIYTLCMEERIDVIHAHYATLFGQATTNALRALPYGRRPRFVLTAHGTDVVGPVGESNIHPYLAATFRAADVLTAVSQDLADRLQQQLPGIPVTVVSNFVDLSLYRARRQKRSPGIRVMHCSNFRPVKQPDLVVDAVRALCRADAILVLIGAGPEYEKTVARAKNMLGPRAVEARGLCSTEAIARELSRTDVLLMPSRYESFSLAALEAHAAGVPVVGTTAGGMREVVEIGKTGALLDPDAPASAWAEALESVLVLRAVSSRARARAALFSPRAALDRYEAVYLPPESIEPCNRRHRRAAPSCVV